MRQMRWGCGTGGDAEYVCKKRMKHMRFPSGTKAGQGPAREQLLRLLLFFLFFLLFVTCSSNFFGLIFLFLGPCSRTFFLVGDFLLAGVRNRFGAFFNRGDCRLCTPQVAPQFFQRCISGDFSCGFALRCKQGSCVFQSLPQAALFAVAGFLFVVIPCALLYVSHLRSGREKSKPF